MIRIVICDDETKVLDEITKYIHNYTILENIGDIDIIRFSSVNPLINEIEDGKIFDIFILDVYIGDDIGTTLAKNIRKMDIESPIIFVTTSIEHAPQGYEIGTLRYLIKPILPQKFYEALSAALAQVEKNRESYVKLKTDNGLVNIQINNIMCSEAQGHYQYITLKDETKIRIRMTVSELFELLSKFSGFTRVGSSYIINLRNVKNISTTEVCLYNDIYIKIPRGKYAEIKNAFWDFQYKR
jgi:DNA-binding LytR/AlgR family response regulator